MTTIIPLILALLAMTIPQQSSAQRTETLSSFYDTIDSSLKEPKDETARKMSTVDRTCVKDKLKLSTSGSKSLPMMQAIVTTVCGFYTCTEDKKALHESAVDEIISAQESRYKDKADCFKRALMEVDPASPIVKDFDPKSVKVSSEDCAKEINSMGVEKDIARMEKDWEKLDKASCGVVNEKLLKKAAYSFVVMKFGSLSEDVLKAGKEEAKELGGTKIAEVCECVLGKI